MVVNKNLPIGRIILSMRHSLAFFLVIGAIAVAIHHYFPWSQNFASILTVLGLALSIFLGTRIRVAYDRW